MKTSQNTANIFSSFDNKQFKPLLWKKLNDSLKTFGCWLVSSWLGLSFHGESILLTLQAIRVAAAVKDVQTTLTALVVSATANRRLYVGLILIGIVAPLAGCSYLLFDRTVVDKGWYHLNNFYLLLLLGPFITGFFICIGVYHLFPNKSKRAFLLALPMGYMLGKIIWLYSVSSNDEFYQLTPFHIVFIGVLISVVVLLSVEWFAWRSEHRFRAFDKRLDGLNQLVDEESISDAKFRSMFRTVYREKKNFPKQF